MKTQTLVPLDGAPARVLALRQTGVELRYRVDVIGVVAAVVESVIEMLVAPADASVRRKPFQDDRIDFSGFLELQPMSGLDDRHLPLCVDVVPGVAHL